MRNLYLTEAADFIAIGIPTAARFGIPGLIAASLLVHLLVTLTFSSVAAKRMLSDGTLFNRLMLKAGAIVCVVFLASQIVPQSSSLLGFVLLFGSAMIASIMLAYFFIMSLKMRTQLVEGIHSTLCRIRK